MFLWKLIKLNPETLYTLMNTFGPFCPHVTDSQVPSKNLCKIKRASLPGSTRGPRAWKASRCQFGSPRKILRRDSDATKRSGCWFWSWQGNMCIGFSVSPMLLAKPRPKPMTHWQKEHDLAIARSTGCIGKRTCNNFLRNYVDPKQAHVRRPRFLEPRRC